MNTITLNRKTKNTDIIFAFLMDNLPKSALNNLDYNELGKYFYRHTQCGIQRVFNVTQEYFPTHETEVCLGYIEAYKSHHDED